MRKGNKFAVGDRVAVYEENTFGRATGVITELVGPNVVVVMTNTSWNRVAVQTKQCRKLTPRKPRRRIWVNCYPGGTLISHITKARAEGCASTSAETVEFIEVRKKKETQQ